MVREESDFYKKIKEKQKPFSIIWFLMFDKKKKKN